MANFKSNASRKRFLALRNKRKYAVGGLTPTTNMYGDNTVPYTASTVYEESNPEYQAQLAGELEAVQNDTSYQENASAELAKQEKIEGYGLKAGRMGLNKLTEKAAEQGITGPDMGENPNALLKSSANAFSATRTANRAYKGVATAKQIGKATTEIGDLVGDAGMLTNYGNAAAKTGTAAGSGLKAAGQGVGVGTVGALMAYGGDKWYDKVTNDDTLEGRADFTNKEKGASALRGAGAGVGAVSTAATLGTMAGIGAANAWNPVGWATLAAAGIGAGVTMITRKRRANKAAKALDSADAEQEVDETRIRRDQRIDKLKDKQYSGFDYGGDNQGPGFYKGGGVKYQSTGLLDKYGSPIGQNLSVGDTTLVSDSTKPHGFKMPVVSDKLPIKKLDQPNIVPTPKARTTAQEEGQRPGYTGPAEAVADPNFDLDAANSATAARKEAERVEYWRRNDNKHNAAQAVIAGTSLLGGKAGLYGNALLTGSGIGRTLQYTGRGIHDWMNNRDSSTNFKNAGAQAAVTGLGVLGALPKVGLSADIKNAKFLSSLPGAQKYTSSAIKYGAKLVDKTANVGSSMAFATNSPANYGSGKNTLSESLYKFIPPQFRKPYDGYASSMEAAETPGPTLKKLGGMRNLPGGQAIDIGNGATKFIGNTHEQGGIMADPKSEVESKEVEKDVTLADGTKNPYIFSEYLNTDGSKGYNDGGESIASVAEGLATNGAPQSEFDRLAQMQEKQAGRSGDKIINMAKQGGHINKYQANGVKESKVPDTNVLGDDLNPFNAAKRLYYDYLDKDRTSDRSGNTLRMLTTPVSTLANSVANVAYPFLGEEQQGKHEEMIGKYQQANKDLDKHKEILKKEGKYKTPWETIKSTVGYQEGGVRKYQGPEQSLLNTPLPASAGVSESSLFNMANVAKPQGLTTAQRNSLGFSGGVNPETGALSNADINFNRLLKSGNTGSINAGYTPTGIRGGLSSTFGKNNNNNASINATIPIGGEGTNSFGAPRTPSINASANFKFEEGGVRSYQTRGLVMSQERQAQYDQHITYDTNTGHYIAPTGQAFASEPDVVDWINRGGLDSYNPNQDGSYMPPNEDISSNMNIPDYISEDGQIEEGTNTGPPSQVPQTPTPSGPRRSTLVNDYSPISNIPYDRYDDGDATSVDLRERNGMDFLEESIGAETVEAQDAKVEEIKAATNKFVEEKEKEAYDKLSAKEKAKLKLAKFKENIKGEPGDGRLLQAAQFIPAAMAYRDKPDYMNRPNKIGGVPRVNLENVSLDDRQASINSDNVAMQRFISNSGMGTAGFAARMAGWQKKEGLSAAVTAEQQRTNTQINNQEAQMNMQVEAQNKAIQAQNRAAEMEVDRFNTESEAATTATRRDAVANATSGLMTQWMDKKKMDTTNRLGAAIEGQTGVLDNEEFRNLTDAYIADNNLDITDKNSSAYGEIYDQIAATEKKKFGGMRQIPRYGYSTK